jgi:phospholipid N-methyltransferase
MKNVHIVHGNAENVGTYLKQYGFDHADYIISGLPFTTLPKGVSDSILTATNKALGENGRFITFQYSLVKQRFFRRYFSITDYLREVRNLPPAYVLVMKNRSEIYV